MMQANVVGPTHDICGSQRRLLFEAMLSMPLKKMGVRPFEGSTGRSGVAVLVDQGSHALLIVNTS